MNMEVYETRREHMVACIERLCTLDGALGNRSDPTVANTQRTPSRPDSGSMTRAPAITRSHAGDAAEAASAIETNNAKQRIETPTKRRYMIWGYLLLTFTDRR